MHWALRWMGYNSPPVRQGKKSEDTVDWGSHKPGIWRMVKHHLLKVTERIFFLPIPPPPPIFFSTLLAHVFHKTLCITHSLDQKSVHCYCYMDTGQGLINGKFNYKFSSDRTIAKKDSYRASWLFFYNHQGTNCGGGSISSQTLKDTRAWWNKGQSTDVTCN